MLMSRYDAGDTYGWHVDNAMMGGTRTDVSFTLFRNDPQGYDGGSLMIRNTLETRRIKLKAGDLILLPSTTLHQVEPVTRDQRPVIVGWVQSLINRPDQHEILFDLDHAIDSIASPEPTEAQNLLSKTRSNLLRQWVDCQALRRPAHGILRAPSPACQDTRFCGKIISIRKR
jgi:PKHD-type hydroxylase